MQIHQLNTTVSSCNTYIIHNNNHAVVIDPGLDSAPIFDYAAAHNLEIGLVLITHCHPDHCSCAADFTNRGIKTHITESDFQLIKMYNGKVPGYQKRELFTPEFYPTDGLECKNSENEKLEYENSEYKNLEYKNLEYGGMEFKIIPAPGHSAGGVCIICGDYLFSGDTLFFNTVGRTDFPTGNQQQLYATLKRLFSLDKDYTVLPGHGKPTTLFFEKENNPFADKAR